MDARVRKLSCFDVLVHIGFHPDNVCILKCISFVESEMFDQVFVIDVVVVVLEDFVKFIFG